MPAQLARGCRWREVRPAPAADELRAEEQAAGHLVAQHASRERGGGDAQCLDLVVVEQHEPVRSGHGLQVDGDEHLPFVHRLVSAADRLPGPRHGAPVDTAHRVAGLVGPHARVARWVGEQAGARARAAERRGRERRQAYRHHPRADQQLAGQLSLLAVRSALEQVADGQAHGAEA